MQSRGSRSAKSLLGGQRSESGDRKSLLGKTRRGIFLSNSLLGVGSKKDELLRCGWKGKVNELLEEDESALQETLRNYSTIPAATEFSKDFTVSKLIYGLLKICKYLNIS